MTNSKLNQLSSIIHFIGIGGIGMSGVAEIMHNLGYAIQGSDLSENFNTIRLKSLGIKIYIGHNPEYIENADYIVISSDIKKDNTELVAGMAKSIPIIRRAEMLAELLRFKTAIAISGSHGKTTTTSLTACMFEAAGLCPTVINGGIINNKSTNAYVGSGEYVIAEADESDGTFIKIPATVGVITNIDPEHLGYYGNFENLITAFRQFILNLPFYGFAVACVDHPTVRSLISTITERKIITYGIDSEDAHVKAFNIRPSGFASTYDVKINLPRSGGALIIENITLSTPGLHNVLNSLSAIAIAAQMDFGSQVIRHAFKNFKGVKRRFTKLCEYNGISVIDDYAHHPAEVEATLATARDVVKNTEGNVIAVFQPHRYTRLSNLFNEFVECFAKADELYISDVYSAGEDLIEGYDADNLIKAIEKKYPKFKVSKLENSDMLEKIAYNASNKDIILMMGAGNITYWAAELATKLNAKARIVA
jgi:UDP-N-acetylmuramate--alanine ligase